MTDLTAGLELRSAVLHIQTVNFESGLCSVLDSCRNQCQLTQAELFWFCDSSSWCLGRTGML